MTLRVLTLSTLFPDLSRPNFGVFVERQTRELASRPDVDVTVIAPLGIAPWPLSKLAPYAPLMGLPRQERWRDLTVYRPRFPVIPKIGGRLHVINMTNAILPLVQRLHRQTPFDVIDASFFYPDGPVARNLSRKLNIPYSVKARGADIHFWGKHAATRGAVLMAGRDAGGLLAVSSAMKRSMAALGMNEDKILVHYTGVDLDRFAPHDRAEAKAHFNILGPIILSVGALIPRKGQDILVRALPSVPDATLLMAGQGPRRAALERMAEELGVAQRVGFLDSVPHDQLPLLYNAADVMALPSESEGLANAWLESMACGTPVAITDVGGARELLSNPAAGRLVERTPDAFARTLQEMLTQQVDREAIRENALRFTWAANGESLHRHLSAIVGHHVEGDF